MNAFFASYVETARRIAAEKGLVWNVVCDDGGRIIAEHRWDLRAVTGMGLARATWVSDVGVGASSLQALNATRETLGRPCIASTAMPLPWRDLYLAVILQQTVVRKNKPQNALVVARWIKHLAAECGDTLPWLSSPDQVRLAYNAALRIGDSGKNALNFKSAVKSVFDEQHLAETPALALHCLPFKTASAQQMHSAAEGLRKREIRSTTVEALRERLEQRKSSSKLPEQLAFWEIVRIVFTEVPRTFSDHVRFAVIKLVIICGFRINEALLVPVDWCRWREYVDVDGKSAEQAGGIAKSLMIRHFAEKQSPFEVNQEACLYENVQHVPSMFEDLVLETLQTVEKLTRPLRNQLEKQVREGRLFPDLGLQELVQAHEMYIRVTGNAIFSDADVPDDLVERCRQSYDARLLERIHSLQVSSAATISAVRYYWCRVRKKSSIPIFTESGEVLSGRIDWRRAYLRVADVEDYIQKFAKTKLSDFGGARLADGSLFQPDGLLFLMPVRNLIEGRNGGLLDPIRYFSVGGASAGDLDVVLDGRNPESLFRRYGQTASDRDLSINTHSFRHLQNTELFRLGIADTIITKRFNRHSVAQSYEYDHRSLAEDLKDIDLPPDAEDALAPSARDVYRMIISNKVRGPIVGEFLRVQRENGDDAAFAFLNAEADGLHVTPYGLCINSFSVDPCPKHLECFNGCRHLARTDVSEEDRHLIQLRDRMSIVLDRLESLPVEERSAGWKNQIVHARKRLENIQIALTTKPGRKPFPGGPDLSVPAVSRLGSSVIDTIPPELEDDD